MTSLADGSTAAGGRTGGGTAVPARAEPVHDVDVPGAPTDLALLQTYEPVLRYTAGELFLPASVDAYLARCSLWADVDGGRRRRAEQLVPVGGLTPDGLAAAGVQYRGRALYLRFVQAQLTRAEVAAWRREDRPRLRGKARFAAVGVVARLIDALVRLSLLVRGRVPGGLVAAAHQLAAAALADPSRTGVERGPVRSSYARVVRTAGYTVLQYWYFYPFNDWRSTFYGVNDHEADWETVAVYLVGPPDDPRPAWVAASAHDVGGPDLRRRWDDPQLRREGDHPVVYPGAGSHSGAFLPGDYVVSVELPALRRIVGWLQGARRRLLPWTAEPGRGAFALPFVDYARGDGVAIGAGHDLTWRIELVDDDTPWVRDYRGLWGLDTHDPFGGERAPAGPRYSRAGALRPSWADPLGWVGLAAVPATPDEEEAHLHGRIAAIADEIRALDAEIETERAGVRGLTAQARSLAAAADARPLRRDRVAEAGRRERALVVLVARRSALVEERAAHLGYLAGPRDPGPPDAHLRHPHLPYAAKTDVRSRFLRVWAAVSTPVLALGLGGLLVRPSIPVLTGFMTFLVVFGVVEAIGRRRVLAFATVVGALGLWMVAVAGLIIALLSSWHLVLAGLLAVVALVLLVVNVRELRSG